MKVTIPQLTIELEQDGTFLLEQEWCGESDRIQLHPMQVRHLAELAGFLPPLQAMRTAPSHHTPESLAESFFAAP